MSIHVAHLTGLWKAGAGAVVRIHDGLRARGVQSRMFSALPVDASLTDAFTLSGIEPTRGQKWKRRFGRPSGCWSRRIDLAAKSNPAFEAFSPPVALERVDLTSVLQGVDVLHMHWVGSFVNFGEFFSQVGIPVVWTLHDQNPYLGGFHYQGDVDAATSMLPLEYECRDIKREALSKLKLTVVGNSLWNETQAMSTGVLPPQTQFSQIYLPLPTETYTAMPKTACKERLGINPQHFVVGFACAAMGNRRKGFVDLVAAIEKLPKSIKSNMTLVSFGFQPSKEIRARVSVPWLHLGRPQGGLEQSPIYSAMDTFVIPSLEEAFGQTALEALACETAVIGTRVGGIPEIVQEEVTGLLAPARSPHRLAECMARYYDDADLRMACGVQGRRLALRRHDAEVISRDYEALYKSVLHASPQQSRLPIKQAA